MFVTGIVNAGNAIHQTALAQKAGWLGPFPKNITIIAPTKHPIANMIRMGNHVVMFIAISEIRKIMIPEINKRSDFLFIYFLLYQQVSL